MDLLSTFFPHWVTLSTLILGSCCCYKVENRWHQGVLQARCFADQDILRKKWNCTYDVATRCSSKLSIWNQCPSHRFGRKSKYGGGDMYWVEVAIKGNERPDSWTIFKLPVLQSFWTNSKSLIPQAYPPQSPREGAAVGREGEGQGWP